MRLTGFSAIEFAEQEGLLLNKSPDAVDGPAKNLTVPEAEAIAGYDPELIWLEVTEEVYRGEPRNMEPGTLGTPAVRRAGQRPDELSPTQNSGPRSQDRGAAGTAGGGAAAGGLAGTTTDTGIPDDNALEEALASGPDDQNGDREDSQEPQAGRAGGAVGGTPAFKRVSRQ